MAVLTHPLMIVYNIHRMRDGSFDTSTNTLRERERREEEKYEEYETLSSHLSNRMPHYLQVEYSDK